MIDGKKILGIAASVAMIAGMAACGNSSSSGSGSKATVTLTVWSPQEDQANKNSWLPTMEKAFEKAHPNYNITWKNAVVAEGDAGTTVKSDPSAAADVYMFANDQLGTLIDANAIGELSDDAASQVKKQNDDAVVSSVTGSDGKLYGVPYTGNTWFMYYNKSKFSSDDIKSLDKMIAKGKVSFPMSNSWYVPAFYAGAGATFYGEKGTKSSAGIKLGDKAEAVTKYLVALKNNPNFVLDADGSGLAGLADGSVDVLFSGTWDASAVKKALGDNYAAAQLPSFDLDGTSTQLKSFSGSKAVAYNPNSKNTKIASQFAAFLGSTAAQKRHYSMRSIVPSDKSLASDSSIESDPSAVAQMNTIANTSILQPTLAAMSNFWTPTENFGKAIANGEVTAANAAEKTSAYESSLN